jgi:hypothetical protein
MINGAKSAISPANRELVAFNNIARATSRHILEMSSHSVKKSKSAHGLAQPSARNDFFIRNRTLAK